MCGRTFARFEGGILARADEMIVVRGVNVFPEAIENLVRQVETVSEYQITVSTATELAELAISIEVTDGADADDACVMVAKCVQHGLGMSPAVTAAPPGSLPRFELKARRFRIES